MDMSLLLSRFRPRTRASGWVAVTFGKRGIHVAQTRYVGTRPQVTKCVFFPVTEITASALERARKEAQLGEAEFTTLLSADEYQLQMVDTPNVPADEQKNAIRWKIKDTLSYPVDAAAIDVFQIPSNKYGADRLQSLYAVAASNETIRKRMELFEKARLELGVIDIPEMAQRNVAALFETEARGLAMLTFGDEGGLLTITCDGELFLARRLEISWGQLLDADENMRQQFMDRAELELQRSLDYFDRQFHYIPVNRILLSAPESLGMDKLLANSLDLPVEMLDLAKGMDIVGVPELLDAEYASYALPVLGAALRRENKVP